MFHKFSTDNHSQRAQFFTRKAQVLDRYSQSESTNFRPEVHRCCSCHRRGKQVFDRKPQSESTNFSLRKHKFSTGEAQIFDRGSTNFAPRKNKFSTGKHNQRAQIFDRVGILKYISKKHNQNTQIFDQKAQSESTNFAPRKTKFSTGKHNQRAQIFNRKVRRC